MTTEALEALGDYEHSEVFSSVEKVCLRYADAMTDTPADVDDVLFAELWKTFDEAQLVELTAMVAWENYRARFNRGFGLDSENYSRGAYCPRPHSGVT